MPRSRRLAIIAVLALLAGLLVSGGLESAPAAQAVEYGERLTEPADGCGTLTVTPRDAVSGEALTLSIQGGPPDTTLTASFVLGVLVGDHWRSISGELDDPTDGRITVDGPTDVGSVWLGTDANGDAERTITYPEFDAFSNVLYTDSPWTQAVGFGVWMQVVVVTCGEGEGSASSVAALDLGDDRLHGSLALDSTTPGVLHASGYPGGQVLIAALAPRLDGVSVTDSVWLQSMQGGYAEVMLQGQSGQEDVVLSDLPGTFDTPHPFAELPPGEYALVLVGIEVDPDLQYSSVSDAPAANGELLARPIIARPMVESAAAPQPADAPAVGRVVLQEWLLAVDTDGVSTLQRPDGSERSTDQPVLAATGPASEVPLALGVLAVLLLLMGASALRRRRGPSTTVSTGGAR